MFVLSEFRVILRTPIFKLYEIKKLLNQIEVFNINEGIARV